MNTLIVKCHQYDMHFKLLQASDPLNVDVSYNIEYCRQVLQLYLFNSRCVSESGGRGPSWDVDRGCWTLCSVLNISHNSFISIVICSRTQEADHDANDALIMKFNNNDVIVQQPA